MIKHVPFFNLLVSIGNHLFDFFRERKKESRERNDRIAALCTSISNCLEKMASDIREGNNPKRECAELAKYLMNFQDVAGKDLDKDEAAELREWIRVSWVGPLRSVKLLREMGFDPHLSKVPEARLDNELAQIEEAAGVFLATANLLKAEV